VPKSLELTRALAGAEAIVNACRGYHVAVSVIDEAGTPKLYYVPDGTDGAHAYTAFRKAYTALEFKMPTSEAGTLAIKDRAMAARIKADSNLLTFAGGLPISSQGAIVGALGVSGAEPSAKDEECGQAGLNQIKRGT
jgi:uncharacterized protein GlcG (DUF336 family)